MNLNVTVLGIGRMGGAMAATLRRAGFPVRVWNRTGSRAEEVAEPGEAVSGAGVVVTGSVVTAGAARTLFGKDPA